MNNNRLLSFACASFAFILASAMLDACSSARNMPSDSSAVIPDAVSGSASSDFFRDIRDGQVYKMVKIGSQTWMAENLNYELPESFCLANEDENCIKYGRLYTWEAAMKACPDGWLLPNEFDWTNLVNLSGGAPLAGKKLKSLNGWHGYGKGSNDLDFNAIPAGLRFDDGAYDANGRYAIFWSSAEDNEEDAYGMFLNYYSERADLNSDHKKYGFSVRCVQGNVRREARDERREGSADIPDSIENFLTDARDGQIYRTVRIGSKIWMAENLNFKTDSSFCFGNADSNCTKYGRLYKWSIAMDSAGIFSLNSKGCGYDRECNPRYPVRGICPLGWHLPTSSEWNVLLSVVSEGKISNDQFPRAGKKLKSKNGWTVPEKEITLLYMEENGIRQEVYVRTPEEMKRFVNTDDYGFSVIPAGYKDGNMGFQNEGIVANFWTSTMSNSSYAETVYFDHEYDYALLKYDGIYKSFSIRCVKD